MSQAVSTSGSLLSVIVNPGSGSPAECGVTYIESLDLANPAVLRELDSGSYVLYGKFKAYSGDDTIIVFESKLNANIVKSTDCSSVMIFNPVNSKVECLTIYDDRYKRTDVALQDVVAHIGQLKNDLGDLENKFVLQNYNLWDGEWEYGVIGADGSITYREDFVTTKNHIDVNGGMCIVLGGIHDRFYSVCAFKNGTYSADDSKLYTYQSEYLVPDGVTEIKVSFSKIILRDEQFIYDKSNGLKCFVHYKKTLNIDELPSITNETILPKTFERKGLNIEDLSFSTKSQNLFDLSKRLVDKCMDSSGNGSMFDYVGSSVSDFIFLKANTKYCLSPTQREGCIYIYDTNLVYEKNVKLSLIGTPNKHFEFTPEKDCYIRFSINKINEANGTMVVEGDSLPNSFVPYECKIPKGMVKGLQDDVIDIYLPPKIYIASGRTLELYNKQIFVQADNYHIQWYTNIGTPMKDKLVINTNDSLIGNSYSVDFNVYDDNLNLVVSKSTVIEIISNLVPRNINILAVGDSLTSQKPWMAELQNLSNGKISFIGRNKYSLHDSDGTTRTGGEEGVSGWTSGMHSGLTVSPFYNSETETWSMTHYINTYCDGVVPDIVMYWTGTNAIQLDPTQNVNGMKSFVEMVRNEYPDMPILITNTIYRGNQDGIGRQSNVDGYNPSTKYYKYSEDLKVNRLANAVYDEFNLYEKTLVIPSAIVMDSEHNYGWMEIPVNSRSTETMKVPMDSVHPQPSGYYQIADIDLAYICKLLTLIS